MKFSVNSNPDAWKRRSKFKGKNLSLPSYLKKKSLKIPFILNCRLKKLKKKKKVRITC